MSENGYPVLGSIWQSVTSKTGRQWEVVYCAWGYFTLRPLGDDVRSARSAKTGKWQGGVHHIRRREEQLRDPNRWRQVHDPVD